jgi:hypothetical protein
MRQRYAVRYRRMERDNIFRFFFGRVPGSRSGIVLCRDLYKLENIVEVLDDTQPDYDFQAIREKSGAA